MTWERKKANAFSFCSRQRIKGEGWGGLWPTTVPCTCVACPGSPQGPSGRSSWLPRSAASPLPLRLLTRRAGRDDNAEPEFTVHSPSLAWLNMKGRLWKKNFAVYPEVCSCHLPWGSLRKQPKNRPKKITILGNENLKPRRTSCKIGFLKLFPQSSSYNNKYSDF